MLAKRENHQNLVQDRLCPFLVHYESRAINAVCNWHANIEIILVLAGSGQIQCGTDMLAVRDGDILVFNANVLHRFHAGEGLVYHCIIIDENFCRENGIFTDQLLFDHYFCNGVTKTLCRDLAESYDAYRRESASLNGAKLRAAVLALLIDLCENHLVEPAGTDIKEKEQSRSEIYVKKAVSYLEAHCTEPASLDMLADLCGISKCHLSREFKRYTGQTVLTYANFLRCVYAQQCIVSGMTVTEAALESGFESVSYFSRTYKKLMGTLPSKAGSATNRSLG